MARATAENLLFDPGRGVGGFGPVVIATLSERLSFSHAISFLALLYIADLGITALTIPEKRDVTLG